MSNPVAIATPTVALTVLKEGISLCQNILVYRQQCKQLELAREQMHRQADMHMASIEQEFIKDMKILESLSRAFKLTLKQTRAQSRDKSKLIKSLEKQIMVTIQTIGLSDMPVEVRQGLYQTLQLMTTQQKQLMQDFIKEGSHAVNAFAIFADHVRTSPSVFTDVH